MATTTQQYDPEEVNFQHMTEASQYNYQDLVSLDSARLVKLYGASDAAAELRCDLIEISLKEPPPYEAISYAWEGQTPSLYIKCDGERLPVTENCLEALRCFRPTEPTAVRLLWIDGICIDQNSTVERNHQVKVMGDIYRNAVKVLVWLGDPENIGYYGDTCVKAFQYLQEAAEIAGKTPSTRIDAQLIKASEKFYFSGFSAMHHILTWFSRLWTLQEVVLGKEALFVFGATTLNFSELRLLERRLDRLAHSNDSARRIGGRLSYVLGPRLFAADCLENKSRFGQNHLFSFAQARRLKTSDPKDKVFALQGLLAAMGVSLPDPEYSKPLATIYREAYRALIEFNARRGTLRDITDCNMATHVPDLPSWVPDLTDSEPPNRNVSVLLDGTPPAKCYFSHDGLRLHCEGLHMETVVSCAGVSLANWSNEKHAQQIEDSLLLEVLERDSYEYIREIAALWNVSVLTKLIAFGQANHTKPYSEDALKAIFFCLKRDMGPRRGDISNHKLYKTFKAWVEILQDEDEPSPKLLGRILEDESRDRFKLFNMTYRPELIDLEHTREWKLLIFLCQHQDVAEWHNSMNTLNWYRTMFATKTGKLGLSTFPIKTGDEIAYFAGGNMPIALRPEAGHHKIVSSVYVAGLTDNTEWDEHEDKLKEFVLV